LKKKSMNRQKWYNQARYIKNHNISGRARMNMKEHVERLSSSVNGKCLTK